MLPALHLLGRDSDLKYKAKFNEARFGHIPGGIAGAGDGGQGVVAVFQNHAPHTGRICRRSDRKECELDDMQIT